MKLILTHDVDGLGSAGEVVEVKDGYGRNYLIPRGYATKWTKGGQKQVDQIAEARRKRAIASLEEANALRDALQSEALTIVKTAGESGRLFGAVTNAEIAAAATEATGKTVDRRTINVTTPIKSLGSYKATAKLHDDIVASLTIEVVEVVTKKKKNLNIYSQMKNINSLLQNLLKIKFLLMKMMLQNYIQIIKQTLMHKIFLFLKLEKLFKEIY